MNPLALVDGQARPRARRTMPEHIAVADQRRLRHYTAEALALVDGLLAAGLPADAVQQRLLTVLTLLQQACWKPCWRRHCQ